MRKGKKNESVRASGKEWVDWWMDGWAGQRGGQGDCTRLLAWKNRWSRHYSTLQSMDECAGGRERFKYSGPERFIADALSSDNAFF